VTAADSCLPGGRTPAPSRSEPSLPDVTTGNQAPQSQRRILALALPFLSAQRLQQGGPPEALSETPLVLVASERGRQLIRAVNPAAMAQGLHPGLALADARALLPDVAVAAHDPHGDAAFLERLARRARRWSPATAARPPHGILIDTSGAAHLFGGETALVQQVVDWAQAQGLTARAALAVTPAAALALARFGAMRIADRPIAALTEEDRVQVALRRAGLKTIGDLAARPRAALAARFGAGLVTALDALTEAASQPLDPLLPVALVAATRRFASPIASLDAVHACLADMLADCAAQLARRAEGGRRFVLMLFRADGHTCEVAVETGQPQRDVSVLLRLFDERIAALNDPLDPGFGYDLLRLVVPAVASLAEAQAGLDGDSGDETRLADLLDRLAARLGRQRLLRLARAESHVPERASFIGSSPGRWPVPAPGEPPARPWRLFDPPQPIEVLAEVPDGPPRRFRWRGQQHDVAAAEGPERIAAEWWRRKDGAGLTRDYWRVETASGRRLWLLRHGLYGAEATHPRWYVHGQFV
jgi:protein ImuB